MERSFRFLHIADLHLGCRQYGLLEREKDFHEAFRKVCDPSFLEREKIDFILISGDMFDHRSISAKTYTNATLVLSKIKELGIPVFAIEGNHDIAETTNFSSNAGSWLQSLESNGLLTFLYPSLSSESEKKRINEDGYKDYVIERNGCRIRVIGSKYKGFQSGQELDKHAEAIKALELEDTCGKPDFCIFMFHGGYEKYLPLEQGGFSLKDASKMSETVDYVALGHLHEHYRVEKDDGKTFMFNPGSLEAKNLTEGCDRTDRGALIVTVSIDNFNSKEISLDLRKDYNRRPFERLSLFDSENFEDQEALFSSILERAREKILQIKESGESDKSPILVIQILKAKNFEITERDLNELRLKIKDAGALHCITKLDSRENLFLGRNISLDQDSKAQKKDAERMIFEQLADEDELIKDKNKFVLLMKKIKDMTGKDTRTEEILSHYEC